MARIPIMRPILPTRAALEPYLDEIDASRSYSNNGPLLRRFEARLAQRFGGSEHAVVCTANGTSALALALLAQAPERGGFCVLPSFTFAATPQAVALAGLRPYFIDVDETTWAITPEGARDAITRLRAEGETVSACVPVCPFGAPLDPKPWAQLRAAEGVAVALDAAAGFASLTLSDVPAAVSLHAVKLPGVGEGGFVLWRDEQAGAHVRRLTNFGFAGDRIAHELAMNAKMSEYHAAVGHAVLDGWEARATRLRHFSRLYRAGLGLLAGVGFQTGWGESWWSSTVNVRTPRPAAELIAALDAEHHVEARQWWASPCHLMPAFADAPHDPLPVTEALARGVLGLPFHEDMDAEDLARVVHGLVTALGTALKTGLGEGEAADVAEPPMHAAGGS